MSKASEIKQLALKQYADGKLNRNATLEFAINATMEWCAQQCEAASDIYKSADEPFTAAGAGHCALIIRAGKSA